MDRKAGKFATHRPRLTSHAWLCMPMPSQCLFVQATHGFKFRKRSQTVVDNAVESYLRDDIDCGSPECRTCPHARASRLPEGAAHYVVPDATTLIELLEVFELPDVGGVILLTSVLRKVGCFQSGAAVIT